MATNREETTLTYSTWNKAVNAAVCVTPLIIVYISVHVWFKAIKTKNPYGLNNTRMFELYIQ